MTSNDSSAKETHKGAPAPSGRAAPRVLLPPRTRGEAGRGVGRKRRPPPEQTPPTTPSRPPPDRGRRSSLNGPMLQPHRFLQVVTGVRQVGKTTLAAQVAARSGLPHRIASADEPTLRGPEWIAQQWDATRLLADDAGREGALLVLDEVQKAPDWAESVKRLWDEDTRSRRWPKVVVLGSAAPVARSRPDREPRRPLRAPASAALELRRDAGGVRLVPRSISVSRRLSRRRAAGEAVGPLVALCPRFARGNDHRPRRAVADPGGQAGAAAPPVRARLRAFGPDPFLHQDAGPASGRRQHDDARPLSRPAGRRGHVDEAAEIRRRGGGAPARSCKSSTPP